MVVFFFLNFFARFWKIKWFEFGPTGPTIKGKGPSRTQFSGMAIIFFGGLSGQIHPIKGGRGWSGKWQWICCDPSRYGLMDFNQTWIGFRFCLLLQVRESLHQLLETHGTSDRVVLFFISQFSKCTTLFVGCLMLSKAPGFYKCSQGIAFRTHKRQQLMYNKTLTREKGRIRFITNPLLWKFQKH